MQPFFEVLRYRADDLMSSTAQRALGVLKIAMVDRCAARFSNTGLPLVRNTPDSLQISCCPLKTSVRPFFVLLRRSSKQHEHAQRVGAIDVYHIDRIYGVILRFGHLLATTYLNRLPTNRRITP